MEEIRVRICDRELSPEVSLRILKILEMDDIVKEPLVQEMIKRGACFHVSEELVQDATVRRALFNTIRTSNPTSVEIKEWMEIDKELEKLFNSGELDKIAEQFIFGRDGEEIAKNREAGLYGFANVKAVFQKIQDKLIEQDL